MAARAGQFSGGGYYGHRRGYYGARMAYGGIGFDSAAVLLPGDG